MLTIQNTDVYGWEAAIRGMRNPMNSWGKTDSGWVDVLGHSAQQESQKYIYKVGANDLGLMQRLCKAGTDHRKFMRMICVSVDITAPLYWWKEFDTYKVGTVANSCSTMHKIHSKEFVIDDFSHEHLIANEAIPTKTFSVAQALEVQCEILNVYRELYNKTHDKRYWWQMIQLMPISYNQKRTVTLNYEVLRNIYFARKGHKLDEWHTVCEWIKTLPYAKELICNSFEN